MNDIRVLDQLERHLVAAVAEEQRTRRATARPRRATRRVRRAAVAVVAVAAAVSGLSVVGLPWPTRGGGTSAQPLGVAAAAAEVTVRRGADRIDIEIAHVAADPADIQRKLEQAGVDVRITFLAASPSLEGKLVGESASADWGERIRYSYRKGANAAGDVAVVSVPTDVDGALVLFMGRRALPGEQYSTAAISPAHPGEALHCVDLYGPSTLGQLMPQIAERGVVLRVRDDADREVDPSTVGHRYIDNAVPWAPGEVLVWTRDRPRTDDEGTRFLRRSTQQGCAESPA